MKQIYIAPCCEVLLVAKEDILMLSQNTSPASINNGPSIGFDAFQ